MGRLVEATLQSEGVTPVELRRAVADRAAALAGVARAVGGDLEDLRGHVGNVAQPTYRITDEDVEVLRRAGYGVATIAPVEPRVGPAV